MFKNFFILFCSLNLTFSSANLFAEHDNVAVGLTQDNQPLFVSVYNGGSIYYSKQSGKCYSLPPESTPENCINWSISKIYNIGIDINAVINHPTDKNNFFVAVGDEAKIWYSTDGDNWTPVEGVYGGNFQAITYSNEKGMFVAVGDTSTIWYSSDGKTWKVGQGIEGNATLTDVVYGNGKFVAVGHVYYHLEKWTVAYSSTDGVNWHVGQGLVGGAQFNSIIYANNLFVAVADKSTIWTSKNGEYWNPTIGLSGGADFHDVAYGNNIFVAVGTDTTIWHSPDGENWTPVENIIAPGHANIDFKSVTFGKGVFIAVGDMGWNLKDRPIWYSLDGIKWEQGKNIKFDDEYNDWPPFSDVLYANGEFITLQKDESDEFPTYISKDGRVWETQNPGGVDPTGGGGGDDGDRF